MLECVVNVSEGQDPALVADLAAAAGDEVLDVHADPDHHRSVFTLVGADAVRLLASVAVARLDLRHHTGVHPRLGVVDVVPFVPLDGSTMAEALAARNAFAAWAADTLRVPCFIYGPERSLPEVRRRAWVDLAPSTGPDAPHPSAGAMCVGARPPLVAYNVYLARADLALAKRVAALVRGPHVRALGLEVSDGVQVSMNLIAPDVVGPAQAYDLVAQHTAVSHAELVGLLPERVLTATPRGRWPELDLAMDRTIEARLAARPRRGATP